MRRCLGDWTGFGAGRDLILAFFLLDDFFAML